jgi:hypothetical protein
VLSRYATSGIAEAGTSALPLRFAVFRDDSHNVSSRFFRHSCVQVIAFDVPIRRSPPRVKVVWPDGTSEEFTSVVDLYTTLTQGAR